MSIIIMRCDVYKSVIGLYLKDIKVSLGLMTDLIKQNNWK